MSLSTYTWKINYLNTYPSYDGLSNLVYSVDWLCTGANTVNPNITSSVRGVQPVNYDPTKPYIEYANLTEETVMEWIQSSMDSESLNAIYTQIDIYNDEILNPPVIPPLPWEV
jgi:hypothetical protein